MMRDDEEWHLCFFHRVAMDSREKQRKVRVSEMGFVSLIFYSTRDLRSLCYCSS
jgi:hypothetical protein